MYVNTQTIYPLSQFTLLSLRLSTDIHEYDDIDRSLKLTKSVERLHKSSEGLHRFGNRTFRRNNVSK
jgi:hypothetical protein